MKKTVKVLMAATLSLCCLAGCGKSEDTNNDVGKENPIPTVAETVAPTEAAQPTEVPIPTVTEAPAPTEVSTATPEPTHTEVPVEEGNVYGLADGVYSIDITLEGGSGRTTVVSPAKLTVTNGAMVATIEWTSPNYDYMLVNGEKYLPVNTEGNSVFEIPVAALDAALDVIGDTVAMSKPKEIEYTLTFHSDSMVVTE